MRPQCLHFCPISVSDFPASELHPFPRAQALTLFYPSAIPHQSFATLLSCRTTVPKATSFFLTSLSSSLAQSLCVSGSSCQEHAFLSFCMAESSLFLALSSICNFLSWACHSVLCHSVLFTALSISKINLSFSFLDHHLFAPSRTKLSKGRLLTGICYADG